MAEIDYKVQVKAKIEEYIEKLPSDWAKRCAKRMGVSTAMVRAYRNEEKGMQSEKQVELLKVLKQVWTEREQELKELVS